MSTTTLDTATEIRSFRIEIPEEQIDDLRRRLAATRVASKELVSDRSQPSLGGSELSHSVAHSVAIGVRTRELPSERELDRVRQTTCPPRT